VGAAAAVPPERSGERAKSAAPATALAADNLMFSRHITRVSN